VVSNWFPKSEVVVIHAADYIKSGKFGDSRHGGNEVWNVKLSRIDGGLPQLTYFVKLRSRIRIWKRLFC